MIFEPKKDKKLTEKQADIANKIAEQILVTQTRIAGFLNKRTAHFSKLQKELLLIIISLLFSGASIYLLITSIS